MAVDQAVVLATPVDTGAARVNWQVGLGAPVTAPKDPQPSGEQGSSGPANAQAAIAEGQMIIAAHRGGDIYISNPLPYIARLNEGSSAQAPAGFVETAIAEGIRAVKGSKILRKGG